MTPKADGIDISLGGAPAPNVPRLLSVPGRRDKHAY
jgi:hypothetical protein